MADEISAGKISIDFSADLSDLHQAFAEAKKGLNDLSGSMTKGTGAMSDFGQAGQVAGGILIADVVKGAVEAMTGTQGVQFGEEAPCPTCGKMCSLKTVPRPVIVRGGDATLDEPVAHCPTCRRDFFPSAAGAED